MRHSLTLSDLNQFSGGSEHFYRHALKRDVIYTEGVKYLAEHGGAYWLLDKIATLQTPKILKCEPFQVWKLTVNEDQSARLSCEDGNDREIYCERLEWTDFPLASITLWFCDNTILLPVEY